MLKQTKKQYFDQNNVPYLPNVGAKLFSLLNGVKQTVPSFAGLYNLDINVLDTVIRGEIGPTLEIRTAIEKHRPLRVRDLYSKEFQNKFPVPDDTVGGVIVCKSAQTDKTRRTTLRGLEKQKILFYTYADTAMSTSSLFKPEWIAEHFIHDGVDAEDTPDWAFNHGHFENQVTYFIGPVNFHWISNGKKYVRQMNTGDTNYITPFVPHTFTTREKGKGLILAVTYGSGVASESYQSQIQIMTLDDYLKDLGQKLPTITQTLITDELGGVIIRHHEDVIKQSPIQLMSDIPFQPETKSLEYVILGKADIKAKITERWGYNVGETPITLSWGINTEVLEPKDSFFIQAGVEHSFSGNGKLLVMEINPEGNNPLDELALISRYSGKRGLERVHSENTQWF